MNVCEALGLTCLEHRNDEMRALRRKLNAAHSQNYRLRKKAQQTAGQLEVEQCARHILHEILMVALRRMDSLEAAARIAGESPQPEAPRREPADTPHQSE